MTLAASGGIGAVADRYEVYTEEYANQHDLRGLLTVGSWQRTVSIQCKRGGGEPDFTWYFVEVQDTNWSGRWVTNKSSLAQPIDDSNFPTC